MRGNRRSGTSSGWLQRAGGWWSGLLFLAGLAGIAAFFWADRHGDLSRLVSSWGVWGVLLAVLAMAVVCMVPLPSEFLLMLDMRVYGVALGVLYAWLGSLLGTAAIFPIARHLGRPVLQRFISEERMEQVESWVRDRGTAGLLVARLLPVPGFAVNYIAGVMRPVRLWPYLWTAAVTMIPYYIGTALVYLGVVTRLAVWIVFGAIALAAAAGLSLWFRRQVEKRSGPPPGGPRGGPPGRRGPGSGWRGVPPGGGT